METELRHLDYGELPRKAHVIWQNRPGGAKISVSIYTFEKAGPCVWKVEELDFPPAAKWYVSLRARVPREARFKMWDYENGGLDLMPASWLRIRAGNSMGFSFCDHPPAPLPQEMDLFYFEVLTKEVKPRPVWPEIVKQRAAGLVCGFAREYSGFLDAVCELWCISDA